MSAEAPTTHTPNKNLDNELLEVVRPAATVLLNEHFAVKERHDWNVRDYVTRDAEIRLLPHSDEVVLPTGVAEFVAVSYWTERDNPWYSRDVQQIFNPGFSTDKHKIPDDNDPLDVFPRVWSAEEQRHIMAGEAAANLLGMDLREMERIGQLIVQRANVPIANSSAAGIAYTAIQESNTAGPYQKLVEKFRKLRNDALNNGKPEVAEIHQIAGDIYANVAQDERLHRKFITGAGKAVLKSGDNKLIAYLLTAVNDVLQNFTMPIQSDILSSQEKRESVRKFAAIRKAGIFTTESVFTSQLHVIERIWKIPEIPNLSGRAAEMQQKIGEFILTKKKLGYKTDR